MFIPTYFQLCGRKHIELWPKVKSRQEMHELYLRYMGAVDRDDYNS